MWGCSQHWFRLPKCLRDKVWATYRAGQEDTMTPSTSYIHVAKQVQEWIKENGGAA
jgi:phosphoserine aminotransferase